MIKIKKIINSFFRKSAYSVHSEGVLKTMGRKFQKKIDAYTKKDEYRASQYFLQKVPVEIIADDNNNLTCFLKRASPSATAYRTTLTTFYWSHMPDVLNRSYSEHRTWFELKQLIEALQSLETSLTHLAKLSCLPAKAADRRQLNDGIDQFRTAWYALEQRQATLSAKPKQKIDVFISQFERLELECTALLFAVTADKQSERYSVYLF